MPLPPLVGRAAEVALAASLLGVASIGNASIGAARLVTLVGTGGAGRARVALDIAATPADHKPGGVWFVDLAPLTEPNGVLPAVAARSACGRRAGSR